MVLLGYQISEIQRLYAENVPIRKIARDLRISRSSVRRVVRGYTTKYQSRIEQKVVDDEAFSPAIDGEYQVLETFFCKRCMATVTNPCIACLVRDYIAAWRRSGIPRLPYARGPIGVNLTGSYRKRYEEIRKKKEQEMEAQREENATIYRIRNHIRRSA